MSGTYTTLDGRVLDLAKLTEAERAYFERAYGAYRQGMAWEEFSRFAVGPEHPLLRTTGGRVTPAVWEHPLYQAVSDLEYRLGIAQGEIAPDSGDDVTRDPLADVWIPAAQAAHEKGVSLPGLHYAIDRGRVIARPASPGGARVVVSANSLAHWTPNRARQASGRHGGRLRPRAAAATEPARA